MCTFSLKVNHMCKTLLLFLILFLSGCMSPPYIPQWTQTYEGAALSDDQEVKLYHQFKNYKEVLVIDNVIYTKSRDNPKLEYKLKPGLHHIDYYLKVGKLGWAIGGFAIEMKAGHTYVLKHDIEPHYFKPWETTVLLRDKTDGKNVRTDHFTSRMSWDRDLQKLNEKYTDTAK